MRRAPRLARKSVLSFTRTLVISDDFPPLVSADPVVVRHDDRPTQWRRLASLAEEKKKKREKAADRIHFSPADAVVADPEKFIRVSYRNES